MPTISVIVPVYNVEPYIRRCIDSILAQTFTDFELILVDDGSPDNCGKICDEYAQNDNRIHVIHQENGGLSAARNAGIDFAFENSDSRWLNFIDSDDWVHPEYLERLYQATVEHDVAVSVCGYVETDGDEPDIAEADTESQMWTPEDFYVEHHVNATVACGKLYRKECFETIRYPVGKIHEDEYVTYRILFEKEKLVFIIAPLYAYFVNPKGITNSEWTPKRLDSLDAIEEQILFFAKSGFSELRDYRIRDFARTLIHHHKQYCIAGKKDKKIALCFQKKTRCFLFHYGKYFKHDFETKINLFWIAHPRIGGVYHCIKNK